MGETIVNLIILGFIASFGLGAVLGISVSREKD